MLILTMDEPEGWSKCCFSQDLHGGGSRKKEFYIGEDKEEVIDDLDISNVIQL